MKIPRTPVRFAILLLVVCAGGVPAVSADSVRVGAYDFGYFLSGDARAKPVQVFDDGHNTYFQFRAGEAVPAIFTSQAGLPQLLVPIQEGPYVRIPEVHGRFVLQVGWAQANVIHGGADRPDAPPVAVVSPSGMAQAFTSPASLRSGDRLVASLAPVAMNFEPDHALDHNSYATPIKGDRVYWPDTTERAEHDVEFTRGGYVLSKEALREVTQIVREAGPSARFTVIGRDDDTYKEGLEDARAQALRAALVKQGVAGERISVRTGVHKPDQKGKLWASTIVVEIAKAPPAMRVAPPAPQPAAVPPANPAIVNDIQELVRSGVLNPAQAQALLARYQPPGPQPAAAAPAPSAAPMAFEMRKSDESIEKMLQRWGREAGWRVLWQGAPVMPIVGDARIDKPDFLQAADLVVKQARAAGYHIKATAYSNNVLQIVGE